MPVLSWADCASASVYLRSTRQSFLVGEGGDGWPPRAAHCWGRLDRLMDCSAGRLNLGGPTYFSCWELINLKKLWGRGWSTQLEILGIAFIHGSGSNNTSLCFGLLINKMG